MAYSGPMRTGFLLLPDVPYVPHAHKVVKHAKTSGALEWALTLIAQDHKDPRRETLFEVQIAQSFRLKPLIREFANESTKLDLETAQAQEELDRLRQELKEAYIEQDQLRREAATMAKVLRRALALFDKEERARQ